MVEFDRKDSEIVGCSGIYTEWCQRVKSHTRALSARIKLTLVVTVGDYCLRSD